MLNNPKNLPLDHGTFLKNETFGYISMIVCTGVLGNHGYYRGTWKGQIINIHPEQLTRQTDLEFNLDKPDGADSVREYLETSKDIWSVLARCYDGQYAIKVEEIEPSISTR